MNAKKIYTVADVGSNTVKCSVFLAQGGSAREIASATEKLGLIAGITDGRLGGEHVDRLCETLAGYRRLGEKEAKKDGVPRERAVFKICATAALRETENFAEIDGAAFGSVGTHITLLSAEEEARAAFAGFRSLNPEPYKGILADMGGGSTELTEFEGERIVRLTSMKFGCLSLYKRFCKGDFPTADEEEAISRYAAERVDESGFSGAGETLCIVGGTGNAMRRLLERFGIRGDGDADAGDLERLRVRLSARDPSDIELIEKLIPTRRETIVPGSAAYAAIARTLGAKKVLFRRGGLREGILKELLDENG